jgi:hypothetical protein
MTALTSARVDEAPISESFSSAYNAVTEPEVPAPPSTVTPVSLDEVDDAPVSHAEPRRPTLATSEANLSVDAAGDFSNIPALRVLFQLAIGRANGVLSVSFGAIKKEICIREGRPEVVTSNIASERFENYLVEKRVLSGGELAMALSTVSNYGSFGAALVGLGLLQHQDVQRHMSEHVRSALVDVCAWKKGSYAWSAGRENPHRAVDVRVDIFEILGAGAMAASDSVIEIWAARHRHSKFLATPSLRVDPNRFKIEGVCQLFDSLIGRATVDEIVGLRRDRDAKARCLRMLYLLTACELAVAK